jgi:two-component system chemotaxis response regulator CheY
MARHILVVDDAATVRMYHRAALESQGWAVDEAVNGIEALEKAQGDTLYDLFLVDVNMPKLDGYGFLQQLRALDQPQAPAIMVSTEATSDDRLRGLEAGANLYLIKPIRPADLVACCRIFLGEETAP